MNSEMQINVPASTVMSNVTMHVEVTDTRVLAIRLKIGTLFIKLAALVFGCSVEVDVRPMNENSPVDRT